MIGQVSDIQGQAYHTETMSMQDDTMEAIERDKSIGGGVINVTPPEVTLEISNDKQILAASQEATEK